MAKLPVLRTIASASAFSLRQCPCAARIFGARRFARDQAPGGSGSLRHLLVVDDAGKELSVIAQAHCGIILVYLRGEVAMRALEIFAIYVTPFLILAVVVKLLMRRHAVDLTDVQSQAGANRQPRKVFLLGAWRTEK